MRIFLTELENVTAQELARLAATLPADRLAQAKRRDGRLDPQCVVGFCLVRYAVAQVAPDADTAQWQRGEYGKPRLAADAPHFNLTHTAAAVAVAVSNEEVGIDLELIRPHSSRFAQRYFSQEEQAQIASATDADAELCRLWTAKEAVGKRDGTGLAANVSHIDTANAKSLPLTLSGKDYWLSVSPAINAPFRIERVDVCLLK